MRTSKFKTNKNIISEENKKTNILNSQINPIKNPLLDFDYLKYGCSSTKKNYISYYYY